MILVCGEALIDLVPHPCGDEVGFVPRAGGSPYNVGIGLGRQGVPVGFLGRVSRDRFGRLLRARLESNGVDTTFTRDGDQPTTFSIVHLAPGEEPEFAFYGEGTADALLTPAEMPVRLPDDVRALHFGSISLVREPCATTYEACMHREHGRRVLSLDPNVRPGLIADPDAYRRRLEGWVALMDLVKFSRADLAWLYPGTSPDDLAARWLALGPGLLVVTQGAEGALAFTARERVASPGMAVMVADTVGAGDAFTAGLLAWLERAGQLDRKALRDLSSSTIRDAVGHANRVAALACTRSGAEPPTADELAAVDGGRATRQEPGRT